MKLDINEIEKDIIREIVSIGMAKAGDSLATISGDKVLLKVPQVNIISSDQVTLLISENIDADIIIYSDLRGQLSGKCILLFNKEHISQLCDVCLKNIETMANESEMRISLVMEVSNILTGALVTQLANIFKLDLHGSPPDYVHGHDFLPFLKRINNEQLSNPLVFLVTTHFINSGELLELPMVLIFDMESLNKMLKIIRERNVINNKGFTAFAN